MKSYKSRVHFEKMQKNRCLKYNRLATYQLSNDRLTDVAG
jgi:hypothetical protein